MSCLLLVLSPDTLATSSLKIQLHGESGNKAIPLPQIFWLVVVWRILEQDQRSARSFVHGFMDCFYIWIYRYSVTNLSYLLMHWCGPNLAIFLLHQGCISIERRLYLLSKSLLEGDLNKAWIDGRKVEKQFFQVSRVGNVSVGVAQSSFKEATSYFKLLLSIAV